MRIIAKIQKWRRQRRKKSARRAEIEAEIRHIVEMQRLNSGVACAMINKGRWPANYGPEKYFDYACGKKAIQELQQELLNL